jgi:KDO2-lipid IV(A) lauroyltransferase
VREFLSYATYRTLGALVGPLPPKVGYWLSRQVGALAYLVLPKMRQALTTNLRHVVGPDADEEEVEALVRRACTNVIKGHYELFRLNRLAIDEIKAMTRIEGMEHIERALERGKGVVLVSAHYGNVDLMCQLPEAYGIPLTAPVWHFEPERLFQYTLKMRSAHGMRMIPTDGPMMELYRALRRGEIIALPGDRSTVGQTVDVEFFGEPASLPPGPVRVAMRTGAALVPAFAERQPDNTFVVRIQPELELPQTGDIEADVLAGTEMLVSIMERVIEQHPEQWLVAVPVWAEDDGKPGGSQSPRLGAA